jgi:WD40 repeat protein
MGKGLCRLAAGDWVTCLAFSPTNGKLLAAGSSDFKAVVLWDVAAGKELRRLTGHDGPVWSVAFSPDGKTLVSGSDDGTVRLWDVATGKEKRCLHGHQGNVRAVAFAPDGRSVASGGFGGVIRLWDVQTGKGRQLGQHRRMVWGVAFSPNGKMLVSAGKDDPVRLWDVAGGRQIREFERLQTRLPRKKEGFAMFGKDGKLKKFVEKDLGRSRGVQSVCFSPDGRTLATAEDDHSVFLWEVETGQPRRDLEGHRGAVFAVAFAPDGKSLASASYDLTALVWDVARRAGRQPR